MVYLQYNKEKEKEYQGKYNKERKYLRNKKKKAIMLIYKLLMIHMIKRPIGYNHYMMKNNIIHSFLSYNYIIYFYLLIKKNFLYKA